MGAQCAISCMARNRFMEIKKYLHLADNQKLVKGDKMSKVTPLYKLLNSSLVKHGMFHEKLRVDESIVPYYGRHAAKMFLKSKPIRDVVKYANEIPRICAKNATFGYMRSEESNALKFTISRNKINHKSKCCYPFLPKSPFSNQ
ncbi:PiggyBac transposable element-derived protein 3 [Trichinella sp. T8]|nr:PiggyBac transposable element-derived protein 3 [Trichinella sp. T8]